MSATSVEILLKSLDAKESGLSGQGWRRIVIKLVTKALPLLALDFDVNALKSASHPVELVKAPEITAEAFAFALTIRNASVSGQQCNNAKLPVKNVLAFHGGMLLSLLT